MKLRGVGDRRDAMTCMARHEDKGADGLLTLSVSGGTTNMATVRASIAEAIGVSGGKIEELTARLADATEAAHAEIFGEELPGERELIVEATMRNLANMIANNRWLDTPGEGRGLLQPSRNGPRQLRLGDARGPATP